MRLRTCIFVSVSPSRVQPAKRASAMTRRTSLRPRGQAGLTIGGRSHAGTTPIQADFDAFLRAQLAEAFNSEDKPMLEALEANLAGAALWDERPVSLPIDVGAALAHKVIVERLKAEAQARDPSAGNMPRSPVVGSN